MNCIAKSTAIIAALALGFAFTASASATVIHMNFDGIATSTNTPGTGGQYVNGYYDNGCTTAAPGDTASASCGGASQNYGITWTSALAGATTSTGLWNIANPSPSASNAIGFLTTNDATMTVGGGFDTGFSFWYTAFASGTVVLNGTDGGNAWSHTINLAATATCGNAPCWATAGYLIPTGVNVTSVNFGGSANFILFDNITLGATNPVPEPAALGMFGLGLLLLGSFVGLRKRFS